MDAEQYYIWKSQAREIEAVLASDLIEKAHLDKVFCQKLADFIIQIPEGQVSIGLLDVIQTRISLLFTIHPLIANHMAVLASHSYDHDKINWSYQTWEKLFPLLHIQLHTNNPKNLDGKTLAHYTVEERAEHTARWQKILAEHGESLAVGKKLLTKNGLLTVTEICREEWHLILDGKKVSSLKICPIFVNNNGQEVEIEPVEVSKILTQHARAKQI